jgi:hypothetical protein
MRLLDTNDPLPAGSQERRQSPEFVELGSYIAN